MDSSDPKKPLDELQSTGLWGYITQREYGRLEQEVEEVRHDFRNLRTIVNDASDLTYKLQSELHQFRVRVYTVVVVVGVTVSALGWIFENLIRK